MANRRKSKKRNSKKRARTIQIKRKWYKDRDFGLKIIEIFLALIFVYFLSNELISPLFSPRVSDIQITPLYIQGHQPETPDENLKYYTIFNVEYELELPYLLRNRTIDLRLPGESTFNNIELITSFQEINPYYEINLNKTLLEGGSFLSYNVFNSILPIKIKTSSREIKKIYAKFNIRETTNLHPIPFQNSDEYWWTDSTISPVDSSGNIVTEAYSSLVGFGKDEHGRYYRFYDMAMKSLSDLEIKGFRISINEDWTYCDEGVELAEEFGKYISINIEPKKIKHILVITDSLNDNEQKNMDVVFDFKSETECYGQWLKYKELIKQS